MKIFVTRHGESMYNLEKRLGGNPTLSPNGFQYASILCDYFNSNFDRLTVWTSCLQRTIKTGENLIFEKHFKPELNEINAGICEHLTEDDVKSKHPQIYTERKSDKLRYKYPEGESYLDLIKRLTPLINQLKGCKENVLIIAHQAILRVIIGLLTGVAEEEIPYLSIPLHQVQTLEKVDLKYKLEKFKLLDQ